MKKFFHQILVILLFYTTTVYPQVIQQWIQSVSNVGSGFNDIRSDASGNIYVSGKSFNKESTYSLHLASFTPAGEQRFNFKINTPCTTADWYIDSLGNAYINGLFIAPSGTPYISLIKYNSSGEKIWSVTDSVFYGDMLRGFAGDISGCSYILKYRQSRTVILKYNSFGNLILTIPVIDVIFPHVLAVDSQGNIIISGIRHNEQSQYIITVKFNASGFKQWQSEYILSPGIINSNYFKLKLYNSDIYIMTSAAYSITGSDYVVIKYYPEGSLNWVSKYNSAIDDEAYDFVIDNKSSVIVTGNNGTVKFSRKGITSWIDTTGNMNSVAVDKFNNVYTTGISSFNFGDMLSLKLSSEGKQLWNISYKEPNLYSQESGYSIIVDTLLNIYTCGYRDNAPYAVGYGTIVKYSQPNIDTSNLKFMPLAIGNIWIYHNSDNSASSYTKSTVTKDTMILGKKYFYVTNFPADGNVKWLRVDLYTGNLIAYVNGANCSYLPNEKIIDSLASDINDTLKECTSQTEFRTCSDTGHINIMNKSVMFKEFQGNSINARSRNYAKDFGLYNTYKNGTSPSVITLKGCVINGIIFGDTAIRYSITGYVKFKDNLQPVTSGKVKAIKYTRSTGQMIVVDSAVINSSGFYKLENLIPDSCDIMAYQDDEIQDMVPGFHDSTIYWQSSKTQMSNKNIQNVDIFVERIRKQTGNYHLSGHIFTLFAGNNSLPLEHTRIYVKSDNEFMNFDISVSSGYYNIDSIPPGNYTFIVDRIGYHPQSRQVELSDYSKDTVDFYLLKYSSVDRDISLFPTKFSLIQNYPNPFNPSTTIVFDIPSTSDVILTIYDLTGREIKKLVDSRLNPGRYKINWDASSFASGVYLYKITAVNPYSSSVPGFSETKKLVLVK